MIAAGRKTRTGRAQPPRGGLRSDIRPRGPGAEARPKVWGYPPAVRAAWPSSTPSPPGSGPLRRDACCSTGSRGASTRPRTWAWLRASSPSPGLTVSPSGLAPLGPGVLHELVGPAPEEHRSRRVHHPRPVAEHLVVGDHFSVVATPVQRNVEREGQKPHGADSIPRTRRLLQFAKHPSHSG